MLIKLSTKALYALQDGLQIAVTVACDRALRNEKPLMGLTHACALQPFFPYIQNCAVVRQIQITKIEVSTIIFSHSLSSMVSHQLTLPKNALKVPSRTNLPRISYSYTQVTIDFIPVLIIKPLVFIILHLPPTVGSHSYLLSNNFLLTTTDQCKPGPFFHSIPEYFLFIEVPPPLQSIQITTTTATKPLLHIKAQSFLWNWRW